MPPCFSWSVRRKTGKTVRSFSPASSSFRATIVSRLSTRTLIPPDFHFNCVRHQIFEPHSAPDGSQHIQWAAICHQVLMPWRGQVAGAVHAFQHTQEFGHIFLVAGWNDIQIERIDWSSVQYCCQPHQRQRTPRRLRVARAGPRKSRYPALSFRMARIAFTCRCRKCRRSAGVSDSIQRIRVKSTPSSL